MSALLTAPSRLPALWLLPISTVKGLPETQKRSTAGEPYRTGALQRYRCLPESRAALRDYEAGLGTLWRGQLSNHEASYIASYIESRRLVSQRTKARKLAVLNFRANRFISRQRPRSPNRQASCDRRRMLRIVGARTEPEITIHGRPACVGIPDFPALGQLPAKFIQVEVYFWLRRLPIFANEKIENRQQDSQNSGATSTWGVVSREVISVTCLESVKRYEREQGAPWDRAKSLPYVRPKFCSI